MFASRRRGGVGTGVAPGATNGAGYGVGVGPGLEADPDGPCTMNCVPPSATSRRPWREPWPLTGGTTSIVYERDRNPATTVPTAMAGCPALARTAFSFATLTWTETVLSDWL